MVGSGSRERLNSDAFCAEGKRERQRETGRERIEKVEGLEPRDIETGV